MCIVFTNNSTLHMHSPTLSLITKQNGRELTEESAAAELGEENEIRIYGLF